MVESCIIRCNENIYYIIWASFNVVHKVCLHIVAIILAILTCKVKVSILNDSKYTAVGVYISTLLTVILLIVVFQLESYNNISVSFISFDTFLDSVTFLVLIFFPKVICFF